MWHSDEDRAQAPERRARLRENIRDIRLNRRHLLLFLADKALRVAEPRFDLRRDLLNAAYVCHVTPPSPKPSRLRSIRMLPSPR